MTNDQWTKKSDKEQKTNEIMELIEHFLRPIYCVIQTGHKTSIHLNLTQNHPFSTTTMIQILDVWCIEVKQLGGSILSVRFH